MVKRERSKKQVAQELEIKDLEKRKYFLGSNVAYSKQGIFVSKDNICWITLRKGKLGVKRQVSKLTRILR